jgi:multicomponent Na+:H+ antiporter subunit D
MTQLVVLPLLVPLLTAVLCLIARQRPALQAVLAVLGSLLHLATAIWLFVEVERGGILAAQMGGWPAPYGITLVADMLSAILVLITALVGTAVTIYSVADLDSGRVRYGYYTLLHVLLMGVTGAFLTGDLFNLYVFFEVMLLASFILLSLGGGRLQIGGALKYVTLNLLSSSLFLMGAGLVYGVAGTLNMAELAQRLPELAIEHPALVLAVGAFLLVSFGIKAGVFPLHFWLPASYHTPPAAVSAVFAGLLTKVGVYALLRACTLILPFEHGLGVVILVIAAATMIMGVLGAVSQFEIRRILGFHIISQIGYMVFGIGLLISPDPAVRRAALMATVFYVTHHILVKTNLFLVGGTIRHLRGTFDLGRLGGLATALPWLAVLFLIPALSLAGIPPLSGFWAKLAIIKAGLQAGQYLVVIAALAAGLLTLLSMIKIWNEAFWKAAPEESSAHEPLGPRRMTLLGIPMLLLAAGTVTIGLLPQPFFAVADRAARELDDPGIYVEAVLGSDGPAPTVEPLHEVEGSR